MVGLGWTLISDIAPENMAGLTGGIFNFCANMASIIAPLIIGVIISATGNFFYALIYVGLTALIGVIAYILSSATLSVSNSSRLVAPAMPGRVVRYPSPCWSKQRHQRNGRDRPVDAGVTIALGQRPCITPARITPVEILLVNRVVAAPARPGIKSGTTACLSRR
nr:D-glucarate permease [Klebsiella pneumoniae]